VTFTGDTSTPLEIVKPVVPRGVAIGGCQSSVAVFHFSMLMGPTPRLTDVVQPLATSLAVLASVHANEIDPEAPKISDVNSLRMFIQEANVSLPT